MPTTKPVAIPLGARINNPLNVRAYHEQWDGSCGEESGFVKFSKPEYGVRCAGIIVLGYQKRGKNTLRGIIATFAPPAENDTTSYIERCSKWTGWDADKTLDLTEGDNLFLLLRAMSRQEIGPNQFSDAVFLEGARLALDKKRVKPVAEKVKEAGAAVGGAGAIIEPVRQGIEWLTPVLSLSPWAQYALIGLVVIAVGAGLYVAIRGRS